MRIGGPGGGGSKRASCQAWLKLLIANGVRIGGPGGGGSQRDHFEAVPQLIGVALAVVFDADVSGGNWVTVGFDSPMVRPSTCTGGRRSKHKKSNGRTRKAWSEAKQRSPQGEGCRWVLMPGGGGRV